MNLNEIHVPVMLERCIELLGPALEAPGAVLVDATLGMGGHTEAFLERFPELTVIGLDRDTQALGIARERLARFGDRVHYVHTIYDGLLAALVAEGLTEVSGILFDLGVSSLQLDEAERGFAYAQDAPLDMRMDASTGMTAADIIATYSEADLRRIFERYGEEKLSARYAAHIVKARTQAPILRSQQLVDILQAATPAAISKQGHPAKRVFQALRIEVNDEMGALETAIPDAVTALRVGGRIVVLAYQSLEDRLVKRVFTAAASATAPPDVPVVPEHHKPILQLLTRGAERASDDEKLRNPRSIPVRLRAAEKVRAAA